MALLEEETTCNWQALKQMAQARVLTMEQLALLAFGGDRSSCYKAVAALEKDGWVHAKRSPLDGRSRCVLLTQQAFDAFEPGVVAKNLAVWRSTEGLAKALIANEIWLRALLYGFPREALLSRAEALKTAGLTNKMWPFSWLIRVGEQGWAVYVRRDRKLRPIVRAIAQGCQDGAPLSGHLVCYSNTSTYRLDLKRFLETQTVPSSQFHVLTLDELDAAFDMIKNPLGWLGIMEKRLEVSSPGGRLARTPRGSRFDWVWDKGDRKIVLLDLRSNNLAAARLMKDTKRKDLETDCGAAHALFLVRDRQHANWWAKHMGRKEWHWFLPADNPFGSPLLKSSPGREQLAEYALPGR